MAEEIEKKTTCKGSTFKILRYTVTFLLLIFCKESFNAFTVQSYRM